MTKCVLRGCGLPTPDWQTIHRPDDALRAYMPFPLFVKP